MSDLPGEVKVVIGVWALAIIAIVLAWYAPDMAGWLERRRKRRLYRAEDEGGTRVTRGPEAIEPHEQAESEATDGS